MAIGGAVGIAAITYLLLPPSKNNKESPSVKAAPVVGREQNGFVVSGSFSFSTPETGMRNVRWSIAASGLAVLGALDWVMGCSASSQEDLTDPNLGRPASTSSSGAGGEGGRPPTSSTGTGGMMPMPGCLPTEPTFVSDMCGVFVAAAGKDGAAGTMTDPLPSLQTGIEAAIASNKYVFACADTFNEQVVIKNGVAIYGGREDCTKNWTLKADGATTVNGPVDTTALIIDTPQHVTLENVDVVAPVATVASKSSIAVLVSQVKAEFKNCKFTSQDAFKGDDGAMVASDSTLNGTPGSPGKAVCAAGNHPGGAAAVKLCGGATSTGGKGGDGASPGAMSGGNGADGTLTNPAGTGGHGNGQTSAATCTSGKDGGDGANGADGAGAIGIGSITAAGYAGSSGGTGGSGMPGIGGGGGGGSKGTSAPLTAACNISDPTDYYGASGGSGGAGGCAGKPGNGWSRWRQHCSCGRQRHKREVRQCNPDSWEGWRGR